MHRGEYGRITPYPPKLQTEQLQHRLSAIDYSDYKHIHYFYQMAGFDNTWIDAGNNNEAYYSNLPAGNYTFKVKMVGNDSDNTIAEKAYW